MPEQERKQGPFSVFRELAEQFSLRSWLLLFFGPTFFGASHRYLGTGSVGSVALLAVLGAIVVLSLLSDRGMVRWPGAWFTYAGLCWVVLLLAVNVINVPKHQFHDEVLLTESALSGITHGVDPYAMDFHNTIVERWVGHAGMSGYLNGEYPNWSHYVYFPGLLAVSLPPYVVLHGLFGWYDQRLVYLITLIILMIAFSRALRRSPVRDALLIAFFLNPFFSTMFIGFNDIVAITALVLTALSFRRKKPYTSAVLFGFSLVSKQIMVLSIPFFLFLLVKSAKASRRSPFIVLATAGTTAAAIIAPFFLWSPNAFIDDTVKFFQNAYPIAGEGFSKLLLLAGAVQPDSSYPFLALQLAFTVPVVVLLFRWLQRAWSPRRAMFATVLALLPMEFFSRYFQPSHAATLILLALAGFLIPDGSEERHAA